MQTSRRMAAMPLLQCTRLTQIVQCGVVSCSPHLAATRELGFMPRLTDNDLLG